jgi:hypothetical protein
MTTMAQALSVIESQHRDIEALFEQISDPDTDHRAALGRLTTQMAAHISVEQSVFLPAIKSSEVGGRDLQKGLKRDYRRMQHLLVLIERRKIDSPDLPPLLTELKDIFQGHVRRCAALATMEKRLPPEDLENLSQRLERAEQVIISHPHPHLLSLGPLSRLTTRIAARFDRGRDRTVSNLP